MTVFIITIVLSLFILYNFGTMMFPGWYYLDLYHGGSAIIEVFHVIGIRWSLPIGLLLLAAGVLGLIYGNKESYNFSGIKYPILIIAVLFSVALIL